MIKILKKNMNQLLKELIGAGVLKNQFVIAAFQKIDRKDFVTEECKNEAYLNVPLPIGYGQTISQPLTVAFMLEILQPEKGNKILEIGSGSGWQTALLSCIVAGSAGEGKVFAVELIPELSEFGKKNVAKYNFFKSGTAKFYCFNAANGMPEEAPFDRIISAASCQEVPAAWKKQLKIGGRMVVPVKNSLNLFIKKGEDEFERIEFSGFAFVPFVDK